MPQRKPLSSKMFLHRATSTAKSADGFLQAYREYLVSGELAEKTSPIVAKVDAEEVSAEIGLEAIKNLVLAHLLHADAEKAEREMEKAVKEPTTSKAYVATAYNAKGEVQTRIDIHGQEIEIRQAFNMEQECIRWLDRRLVNDCASDCFGLIVSTRMFDGEGEPITTTIMRKDSLSRMFPSRKSPFMKRRPTNSSLTSKMRVRGDHSSFSRG